MGRFVGTVDQVDAEWSIAKICFQSIDGLRDAFDGKPCRAEAAEHSGPAHCFNNFHRSYPVGHCPGHVRVLQGMVVQKFRIAEMSWGTRRKIRCNWKCGRRPSVLWNTDHDLTISGDGKTVLGADYGKSCPDCTESIEKIFGIIVRRRGAGRYPVAKRGG